MMIRNLLLTLWMAGTLAAQTFIQMSDPQLGMYTKNANEHETVNFEFAIASANRLKPAFGADSPPALRTRIRRAFLAGRSPTGWSAGVEITCRVYRPRQARDTPLFRLVAQHLEEFLRVYEERFAKVHGPAASGGRAGAPDLS